jgi:hypothetical protein
VKVKYQSLKKHLKETRVRGIVFRVTCFAMTFHHHHPVPLSQTFETESMGIIPFLFAFLFRISVFQRIFQSDEKYDKNFLFPTPLCVRFRLIPQRL